MADQVARMVADAGERGKKIGYLNALKDLAESIEFFPVMTKNKILDVLQKLEKELK